MSRVFRGKSSHTQKQHAMISVSQRYIACKSCSSCKFHAAPLPSPTPLGQHLSPRGVPSLWALRGVTEWHTRRRFEIRTSQLSTFSSNHSKIQQVKSSHHLRSPALLSAERSQTNPSQAILHFPRLAAHRPGNYFFTKKTSLLSKVV